MTKTKQITLKDLINSFNNGWYLGLDVKDLIRDYGDTPIIINTDSGEENVTSIIRTTKEIILTGE